MAGILCVVILFCGSVLTIKTRGVQRYLPNSFVALMRSEQKGAVSSWGALCTTLAATIGTGNIVGVALAISVGGAGALAWMVVASLLGMAIKYCECFVAVRYRAARVQGYYGGPYLYIEKSIGKKAAMLYALCGAAAGSISIGTSLQMDSMLGALDPIGRGQGAPEKSFYLCVFVALLAGIILWGGARRISSFCEAVVPLMAIGYIVCSVVILVRFRTRLPAVCREILISAFSFRASSGGILGALTAGISRGIFSNEAGLGSSGIAAAAVEEGDAHRQGLVGMCGVFIDTTLMCLLSGMTILVSGASPSDNGAAMSRAAFSIGLGQYGGRVLTVFLCFFAFTTIVGWYYFASECFTYVTGGRWERIFCIFYVGMLLITPFVKSDGLWFMADALNTGMALPNLLALMRIYKEGIKSKRGATLLKR